jgi:hypothetical protein
LVEWGESRYLEQDLIAISAMCTVKVNEANHHAHQICLPTCPSDNSIIGWYHCAARQLGEGPSDLSMVSIYMTVEGQASSRNAIPFTLGLLLSNCTFSSVSHPCAVNSHPCGLPHRVRTYLSEHLHLGSSIPPILCSTQLYPYLWRRGIVRVRGTFSPGYSRNSPEQC